MVQVAVYVRVSTEEQAKEGISLAAQKDRCKAFCIAKGWDVHKIYADPGHSAGTMKRPALLDLLKDGMAGKFQVILVYKIDRFSRNLKDLVLTLEDLKKKGINFSSVTEQIDTTTAMGEAFFQIIGVFAQLERGMVKERVELAFQKKISGGEALHRPPFGYTFKNNKLVPHPEESETVKKIFSSWGAGAHYREIAVEYHIPISTLYDVIKNPIYIGKIRYRGKLFDGSHQPLIDEETFWKINKLNNS